MSFFLLFIILSSLHDSLLVKRQTTQLNLLSWPAKNAAFWLDGTTKWVWASLCLYAPFTILKVEPHVWLTTHMAGAIFLFLTFSLGLAGSRILLMYAIIKNVHPSIHGEYVLFATPVIVALGLLAISLHLILPFIVLVPLVVFAVIITSILRPKK